MNFTEFSEQCYSSKIMSWVCLFLFDVQPTWTEEMSQGLFAEDDKDMDEAEKSDDDYEGAPAAAVRAVDRKTKQQRRKEKENQEEVT